MSVNNHCQVMIYVQHLLGIGHLRRSWLLARALADSSIKVALVSGGMPVSGLSMAGLQFYQLPPVRCLDANFDRLVDEQGQTVSETWKASRRDQMLDILHSIEPQILITETFPFGRRMMRFEVLPLLKAAMQLEQPPVIAASIRDILQPKTRPGRNKEILGWLKAYYDQVLVHGDPKIASLDISFPFTSAMVEKLNYTGYISNRPSDNGTGSVGYDEIIISGGGGAASLHLLKTAIAAKPLSKLRHHCWRILAGNNPGRDSLASLRQLASDGVIVETNREDFPQLLKNCSVSVSQAGYNTVMDILQQKARAVLVPFAEADELEQSLRAECLAQMGRVQKLDESSLSAQKLAEAIDRAATMSVNELEIDMQGLKNSVRLISTWLRE